MSDKMMWLNQSATPIGDNENGYFEGTAEELAKYLGGTVDSFTGMGVRLALPCGPDCLKLPNCWTYRSFYPFPIQKDVPDA